MNQTNWTDQVNRVKASVVSSVIYELKHWKVIVLLKMNCFQSSVKIKSMSNLKFVKCKMQPLGFRLQWI